MYMRHDKAPKNRGLIKIENDLEWKLGVAIECTRKGVPPRNPLAKVGFAVIAGKARQSWSRLIRWKNQVQAVQRMFQLCSILKKLSSGDIKW